MNLVSKHQGSPENPNSKELKTINAWIEKYEQMIEKQQSTKE